MLKAINITKQYEHIVLKDISFSIPDSSIILLNGENGIGKTTLLYILGGLLEFDGDVFFNDISAKQNFQEYISKVAVMPNTPYIFEYLNVTEMIDLVISLSDKNKQVSQHKLKDEFLHKLNLIKYKDTLTKNLSLGTKQKVSFICSFISSPSIILIDEPFVNFDNASLDTIVNFIKDYAVYNNSTIIFSTHSNDSRINSIATHKLTIQSFDNIVLTEVDRGV